MPIHHASANITVTVTVEQSSVTLDKTLVQETKEEVWFVTEDGKKILVILDTIYF